MMNTLFEKIKRNIKSGTLIDNAIGAARNRLHKSLKHANVFYRNDPERVITKKYQSDIPGIDKNHFRAGNYYLDKRFTLDPKSVIYSLGVLTDIRFDLFVSSKYGSTVHLYDPTPTSIEYMKQHKFNQLLMFHPVAVWTNNGTLKFYFPKNGSSASVIFKVSENYFEAECFDMKTLMKQNNHAHIDLFKADIEGAALPILEQMISEENYPDQIIVEFERPKGDLQEIDVFFQRVSNVRDKLRIRGYSEFLLPRANAKYYSLEMLFVNTSKLKQ